jgi:hypothetical protein
MRSLLRGKTVLLRGSCVMVLKKAQTALAYCGVAENN